VRHVLAGSDEFHTHPEPEAGVRGLGSTWSQILGQTELVASHGSASLYPLPPALPRAKATSLGFAKAFPVRAEVQSAFEGFAESGAHPDVLAAGIKPGEELRTRADGTITLVRPSVRESPEPVRRYYEVCSDSAQHG
jgi:hypothetical protein